MKIRSGINLVYRAQCIYRTYTSRCTSTGTDPESANRRFAACPTALLLYRATRPRNAPTHTYRRANNYNLLEERSNGGGGGGGGAGGGGSR